MLRASFPPESVGPLTTVILLALAFGSAWFGAVFARASSQHQMATQQIVNDCAGNPHVRVSYGDFVSFAAATSSFEQNKPTEYNMTEYVLTPLECHANPGSDLTVETVQFGAYNLGAQAAELVDIIAEWLVRQPTPLHILYLSFCIEFKCLVPSNDCPCREPCTCADPSQGMGLVWSLTLLNILAITAFKDGTRGTVATLIAHT
jgi:hypothetical protein